MGGSSQPLRSPLDEATASCGNAPLTGRCNPGRILGRVLAIDHIQLAAPAGCEAAARRFFGELLGLEELRELELGKGSSRVALGAYVEGVAAVLANVRDSLRRGAPVVIFSGQVRSGRATGAKGA